MLIGKREQPQFYRLHYLNYKPLILSNWPPSANQQQLLEGQFFKSYFFLPSEPIVSLFVASHQMGFIFLNGTQNIALLCFDVENCISRAQTSLQLVFGRRHID